MKPGGAAEGFPNSSSTQESLQSTFQHPAGLQTARDLVQAVARHWFSRGTHHTSPITTFSDASPEVEGILSSILVFRDSQSQTSHEGRRPYAAGVLTNGEAMDVNTREVPQSRSDMFSRQTSTHRASARNLPPSSTPSSSLENGQYLSGPRSFPLVSYPHKPFPDKSPESEIRSIFGSRAVNNTLLQGTESPYRVESPASQAATTTPLQLSTQQSHKESRPLPSAVFRESAGRGSHFSVSDWDDEPVRRAHVADSRGSLYGGIHLALQDAEARTGSAVLPSLPKLNHSPNGMSRSFITTSTSSLLPSAGLAGIPTQPISPAKISPTIKSFLAVNKSVTNNKEHTSEREIHFHNKSALQSDTATIANTITSNEAKETPQENFFSSLQSPSPVPAPAQAFTTPQLPSSPNITDLSSPNLSDKELDVSDPQPKMPPRKRKGGSDGVTPRAKKQKVNDPSKKAVKKVSRAKEPKPEQAKEKLPQAILMRILEFTPPSFLSKARLISKSFKGMVDEFDSIFVNCRKENFGWDMPAPPKGLTERQYSDLFGGKGCLEPECTDELCSRTHWSWAKRWCQECWKSKIEREDRALKKYQGQYGRVTLTKLFECIPVGIHDSFLKPHDYIDNFESRSRQAPRLYKYYLASDIQEVINDYEALTPSPFLEDPTRTAAENATARAAHQTLMGELDEKRNQFFTDRKKDNDEHMAKVQKIETAIKEKREEDRKPNNENRDARRVLFLRRAQEDLPHITQDFIKETKAFKAATRIFRDPGSERGWQTLKPKLEEAWEEDLQKKKQGIDPVTGLDGTVEADEAEAAVTDESAAQEPSVLQPQPQRSAVLQRSGYLSHATFDAGSSISDLGSSMNYRNNSATSHLQHLSGMYSANTFNRTPSNMTYGGGFLSQAGLTNAIQNSYTNHPNPYQQIMGSHSANNYSQSSHDTHHGSYQARRDMSIQSVLSDPIRMHFNSDPDVRQP